MDVDGRLEGSESRNELQTASDRSSAIAAANKWSWGRLGGEARRWEEEKRTEQE